MPSLSIINANQRRDLPNIIAQSAQRTGVDFQYLIAQAQLESGMRPEAKASTSSATGLYQFIDQTWLGLVKSKGDQYGVGWAQNAITQHRNGNFSVANNAQKTRILALRKDPELSANLAGEFARSNSAYIEKRTGRKPESVDLYLAHFLGPAGASKFLKDMQRDPDAPAAAQFGRAARANRSIFYNRAGQPKSFQNIRDRFEEKLTDASQLAGAGNILPASGKSLPHRIQATASVQPADYLRIAKNQGNHQSHLGIPKPFSEQARLAYLMLASLGTNV